jgi:hypothetical protein
MEMDEDGLISRPQIGWKATGEWRVTGAVEYNNFGYVITRLSLADVKAACNSLEWQYKNGKQRIHLTDLDHGTAREWGSKHTVKSFIAREEEICA